MARPKPTTTKPGKRSRTPRLPDVNPGRLDVNPALGAQTRKVLQQHYRAKHGVK